MKAILYGVPASHPAKAAELMLEHKGIPYKRRDLVPVASRGILTTLRYPRSTVPALKLDGRRISGSREVAQALEELRPEPPLYPGDPDRRAAVETAERWGEGEFQQMPRSIAWWSLKRDSAPLRSFSEGARLGIPVGLAVRTAAPIIAMAARINRSTDENVRAYLAALPAAFDRIDGWIADGILGGEDLNAADFQIATSLRLLLTFADIRPALEGRPAGALAMRVVPEFHGHVPPVIPEPWLEPLRS